MAAISKESNRNLTRWILCFGVMIEPSAILLIHSANLKKKSKMTTELQNKVWSLLPKEFKEEVKDCYKTAKAQHKENFHLEVEAALIRERIIMLEYFFGFHNLTPDAEEEELLTCEKYKVEEALNYCDELDSISGSHNMLNWGKQMIVYLFGSKCLSDETKQETKQETNSFQM